MKILNNKLKVLNKEGDVFIYGYFINRDTGNRMEVCVLDKIGAPKENILSDIESKLKETGYSLEDLIPIPGYFGEEDFDQRLLGYK